ncbi:metallophosphoesterase [candidate division KSB1 bacterium]|nr:metallophosphoesterase [candidate division KSB1 bacterium]
MKIMNFLIFLSVFLTIYGSINYYIFIRGWQTLPGSGWYRGLYLLVFLTFSLAFVAGRILERFCHCLASDFFVWLGSFWLAAMLYFFLIIVMLDLLRLVNHWVSVLDLAPAPYLKLKQIIGLVAVSTVILLITVGHWNATHVRVKTLKLTLNKAATVNSLNIVMASDIHLGTIIGKKRFCRMVEKINALTPDLVLFPGDIMDEDLGPVIKENLGEALEKIQAKYGVIAITGNHEYIGGVEAATRYLQDHQIIVLRDSVLKLVDSIFIIGREDRMINRFTPHKRKSLSDLMQQVTPGDPVLLMDHQPVDLNEAVKNGVDLQLSGHTHHGQLWPLNYVTQLVYEISWGYRKIGHTHFYVSCGVGTWGPPVRLGNQPELVQIILNFQPPISDQKIEFAAAARR